MPYELIVDGKLTPLGDARYLLSPGDLYALHQVPEIVEIGVSALKIEGRYKDSDYVALTTRAYRQAVDDVWAGREHNIDRAAELQLEQVYSRGMGPFFLNGTDHQAVVSGRAPRHRGVLMGRVARLSEGGVIVEPAEAHRIAPLKPGDGVVFDAADWRSPEEPEEGGRVYQAAPHGGMLELRFGNGVLKPSRIRPGDLVWRTHDPDLDKVVRPFIDAATPIRKQPVRVRVVAREGEPLVTEWRVGEVSVRVESEERLGTARNRGLEVEYLTAQLGRLGNTPYELAGVELEEEGSPFAPSSLLNGVRREAVERLQERQGGACFSLPVNHNLPLSQTKAFAGQAKASPTLHLLLRTPEQLDAALALSPASITLDYLDLYGLRPSLDRVRAAGILARVASPRVLKPGEERIVDFLLGCDCPILVRSTGPVERPAGTPPSRARSAISSLNAANAVTASELPQLGLVCPSISRLDLNAAQVSELLARQIGGDSMEVVAYQHLPVFHTEHCVFCRFLSSGTSYRDCGRPCEKHQVSLRDSAGRAHPLMADVGCRNTVFGAEAQEASLHLEDWMAAGIHRFRLEFAHETGDQVSRIARAFEDALAGRRTRARPRPTPSPHCPTRCNARQSLCARRLFDVTSAANKEQRVPPAVRQVPPSAPRKPKPSRGTPRKTKRSSLIGVLGGHLAYLAKRNHSTEQATPH